MIYFTSDQHYRHRNLLLLECKRKFKCIESHDAYLVYQHNQIVSPEDTVFHLGDFSFGNKQTWTEIFQELSGKHILMKGNHDRSHTNTWLKKVGFKDIISEPRILHLVRETGIERCIITHSPEWVKPIPGEHILCLCGHIHSKWFTTTIFSDDETGSIKFLNVGVDIWNFKPLSIDNIFPRPENEEWEIFIGGKWE